MSAASHKRAMRQDKTEVNSAGLRERKGWGNRVRVVGGWLLDWGVGPHLRAIVLTM